MSKNIYVRRGSEQFGPYDREALVKLINQGHLSPQDLAWHETLGQDWKPLGQVLDLKPGEVTATASASSSQASAATGQAGSTTLQTEVVITGVKISFMDLVVLILKVWLASIPAMIIMMIVMLIIELIIGGLVGGLVIGAHSLH